MRVSRSASIIAAGAVMALAAAPAQAAPPPGTGNCVSAFTTGLPTGGGAGSTIRAGAHLYERFGQDVVSPQARAPLAACRPT